MKSEKQQKLFSSTRLLPLSPLIPNFLKSHCPKFFVTLSYPTNCYIYSNKRRSLGKKNRE
ncbi:hypothetical protein Scep_020000 [Stephania cephalantha]|uniref:Uncharacterized protein n=1 Tax=Stephania cephalantha TaxID=152367 RepID=A0AAP0NQE4_9MAGN